MQGACAHGAGAAGSSGSGGVDLVPLRLIWGGSRLCPAVKDRYRDRDSSDDSSSESDSSDERIVSFLIPVSDVREAFKPPTAS